MSQQINLYNPLFLKQKKIFSARAMAQGLGVITLGLLAVTAFAAWQVKRLEAEVARSEARLRDQAQRIDQARSALSARKPSPALEREVAASSRELEMRKAVFALLDKGVLPQGASAGAYLRALAHAHVEGLWLTGFESSGQNVTLTGRALKAELVPEYLRRLGREDVLRGREFAMLKMERAKADDNGASPPWIEFVLRSDQPAASGREGS